ncbi:aminotransferase class I/II-fold pyridoxal phosphate-dependent enzyme [Rhodococcus sp. BP-252]|uniref:8-amino-7-oxononanoate synthase n=1 Tax=Rhodococcoides kyotonense TaxID=398843 RepID=A0A177YA42_9NOCA|nr:MULTISPECIES: aminotransferase class I/II-fold pyridoxal phosphate-dependent enzyme [Rhodococcus]NIL74364.1 8-amino-7-oxononanoate synthase [Rhodococcus sp. B10]MBY6413547.1 aminotransferase class I/II-fold pyridoxal phosphate-dependent enzyme [Rhodococcus sp. BP-320]MBY6418257.1 aminotransferase class I/II-fold pyridoxal phosphate-dependent enzyme [Rhodococcus sp. BP-321]MBY6422671.1 aminotransferase class I/II-fold pyridoxal phosphate-dependent enzyme [Rhodococcus sp. BP-324]MBY6428202.1 
MTADSREIARQLLARTGYSTVQVTETAESAPTAPRTPQPSSVAAPGDRGLLAHPDIVATVAQFDGVDRMFDSLNVPNPLYLPHQGTSGPTIRQLDRDMINFGCFNYLGLSADKRVAEASKAAIDEYGTSVSASRIVSGQIPLYAEFERRIAETYDVDDAVITTSGYLTNAAAVGYLLGQGDLAVCDALVHSSIVSGTEWAGCRRISFRHNDPAALEAVLKMSRGSFRRAMVVLESHYSMDGDVALLPPLIDVARKYDCAVMIDEAHSFGVLGEHGHGIRELYGLPGDAVDVWMGTMSKALGSVGGFLAGSRELIRAFKYSAPGLSMFATAPAPASIAAALAALDIVDREPERVARLRDNASYAFAQSQALGFRTGLAEGTPILPIIVGDTQKAVLAGVGLLQAGINANSITHPSVPLGEERLRFFISSEHTREQIDTALTTVAEILG